MKKYITILLLVSSVVAFGQSKKDILTKKWKLNKTEEFGQQYDLLDNQKNDWLEFKADGKFSGVIEGKQIEGTWTASASSAVLKIDKAATMVKINWTKVKKIESNSLAIEYQNGDLITSTMLFIPAE